MIGNNANQMKWNNVDPGRFEIWYTMLNHRQSESGFWIRSALISPQRGRGAPFCLSSFAFNQISNPQKNLILNQRYPITKLKENKHPFQLLIGDSLLEDQRLKGELKRSQKAPVTWDLRFAQTGFLHHPFDQGYRPIGSLFDQTSSNITTQFSGSISFGTQRFDFDEEPGCQGHIWGERIPYKRLAFHCNYFRKEPTAAIELVSLKFKKGPVVSPALTVLSLYLGSEVYHFNSPFTFPLTSISHQNQSVYFTATGKRIKVQGQIDYRPADLLIAEQHSPNGKLSYLHNTTVANAKIVISQRRSLLSSFRPHVTLDARGTAHLQFDLPRPQNTRISESASI